MHQEAFQLLQFLNELTSSSTLHPSASRRINGLTHMNLTKLDVLSEQDEILVGVRYRAKDGTILSSVPADLDILEGVTVSVSLIMKYRDLLHIYHPYCF